MCALKNEISNSILLWKIRFEKRASRGMARKHLHKEG